MKNDILRLLAQERNADDVYFTTMIDLYAISTEFPGRDEAEKLRHSPENVSQHWNAPLPMILMIRVLFRTSNYMSTRRICFPILHNSFLSTEDRRRRFRRLRPLLRGYSHQN